MSGGLVCGLQRRVYQVELSGVHSHRVALRYAWGNPRCSGRRALAITGHLPRRQTKDTGTALQDQPPRFRRCSAHRHDVPLVDWHAIAQARHMPAAIASAESHRRKNAKKACPLSHTIGSHDARASVPVREFGRRSGFFEQPGREDVRPDLCRDPGGRCLKYCSAQQGLGRCAARGMHRPCSRPRSLRSLGEPGG